MVSNYSVFRSQINDRLVRERLLAMLAAFFGVLAMVLTMVGLYGMLSYTVSQRRPEIGVRIALGAEHRHVIGLIMREAGWMLAIGVVVGAIVSLLGGRSASALLFGLTPNDPLTLGSSVAHVSGGPGTLGLFVQMGRKPGFLSCSPSNRYLYAGTAWQYRG